MSIFDFFHSKNYLQNIKESDEQADTQKQVSKLSATKHMQNNRRQNIRHEALFTTNIRYKKQHSHATVINYSETGLAMLIDQPMRLDASIEIELLPRDGHSVIVIANVKRCVEVNKRYMIGVKIVMSGGQYTSLFRQLDIYGSANGL
ncbi:MAG: hypothetical protein ISEC1_P0861 [Thiomicrorhabdus sp.]|nr:MAG: hypothetical protein ISEC1_P0861 [Thiomicrorhabdus sp.]